MAGRHTHLCGLATAIHEISGLIVIAKIEQQLRSSCHESNVYLIIQNLVLWARSRFNDFVGNDNECFWSIGVLECWSVEKDKALVQIGFVLSLLHYSISPLLQQTLA